MDYFQRIQDFLRSNWFMVVGLSAVIFPSISYLMDLGVVDEFPHVFSSIIGLLNVVAAFFGLAPIPQPSQSAVPSSVRESK